MNAPTPAPALTDEQIDGGYTAEGIALQIDAIAALWKSEYGDPRPVFDLIAAVIARAKQQERGQIADDLKRWASVFNPAATAPVILRIAADLVHHGQTNWPDTGGAR